MVNGGEDNEGRGRTVGSGGDPVPREEVVMRFVTAWGRKAELVAGGWKQREGKGREEGIQLVACGRDCGFRLRRP